MTLHATWLLILFAINVYLWLDSRREHRVFSAFAITLAALIEVHLTLLSGGVYA